MEYNHKKTVPVYKKNKVNRIFPLFLINIFNQLSKVLKTQMKKMLEESHSTRKAIEEPNDSDVKTLDLNIQIDSCDGVLTGP